MTKFWWSWAFMLNTLVLSSMVLSGCQSGTVPQSTDAAPDEVHRQLIWLKLDELLPLEHAQRYGALFEQLDLPETDRPGRRAQFLKLTKCAETVLGPVTQVNKNHSTFKRVNGAYLVTLPVSRVNANVLEQWAFNATSEGSLKWKGLHWLTNRSDFLTCAAAVPGLAVKQPKSPVKQVKEGTKAEKPTEAHKAAITEPANLPLPVKKTVAKSQHQLIKPAKDSIKKPVVVTNKPPITDSSNRVTTPEEKPVDSQPVLPPHDPDAPLSHTNQQ